MTTIIDYSGGGVVGYFEQDVQKTIEQHEKVVINGECYSSCTLYLQNPLTCVTKNAKLAFHAVRNVEDREISVEGTRQFYDSLPPKVRDYILAHGGFDARWIVLEGEKLWAIVKLCEIPGLAAPPRQHPEVVDGFESIPEKKPYDYSQHNFGAQVRHEP